MLLPATRCLGQRLNTRGLRPTRCWGASNSIHLQPNSLSLTLWGQLDKQGQGQGPWSRRTLTLGDRRDETQLQDAQIKASGSHVYLKKLRHKTMGVQEEE